MLYPTELQGQPDYYTLYSVTGQENQPMYYSPLFEEEQVLMLPDSANKVILAQWDSTVIVLFLISAYFSFTLARLYSSLSMVISAP